MAKSSRQMRRCLLDVHGMKGVTCGGLMYTETMVDHCIHMHGTADGKWSGFIVDEPYTYNQGGRERCECGNFKSLDLKVCLECTRADQTTKRRVYQGQMEPEEVKAKRNAVKKALRATMKAAGMCAQCFKFPAVKYMTKCQRCRGGTTKPAPIEPSRSSPVLQTADDLDELEG